MAATSAIRPTTIKIDTETKERMQRLAESRQRSSHWLILEAIREYVEREEKREVFRQDGIKAWNAYQANGLHVTLDEADAWLAKLEAGQDIEPPECHS
jgi:predicted transcriptional regulator